MNIIWGPYFYTYIIPDSRADARMIRFSKWIFKRVKVFINLYFILNLIDSRYSFCFLHSCEYSCAHYTGWLLLKLSHIVHMDTPRHQPDAWPQHDSWELLSHFYPSSGHSQCIDKFLHQASVSWNRSAVSGDLERIAKISLADRILLENKRLDLLWGKFIYSFCFKLFIIPNIMCFIPRLPEATLCL